MIPPFDHPAVMAGQGTAALELIEQDGPLDVLIVPVGGGGLIAGLRDARPRALAPAVRVDRGRAGGRRRHPAIAGRGRIRGRSGCRRRSPTACRRRAPGALTFEITRRLVSAVELVSDAEIAAAMSFLFERLKLVVEPSGAVGVAALLSGGSTWPAREWA